MDDRLQTLLTEEPRPPWSSVVALLEGLDATELNAVGPALDRFPDSARDAPEAWWRAALDGEPPAALALCRSLSIRETLSLPDDTHAERLAEFLGHPALAGLTSLDLGEECSWLDAGVAQRLPPGLRHLTLRTVEAFHSAAGDEQLEALAGSPRVANLETLTLEMCVVYGSGVAAMGRSPHLGDLRRLALYGPAKDDLCRALAGATGLTGLRELALCADRLGPEGAAALAESPWLLRQLEQLEFRVDESCGFDWCERFDRFDGAESARRFAAAVATLLPEFGGRLLIDHTERRTRVEHGPEELATIAANPNRARQLLPSSMQWDDFDDDDLDDDEFDDDEFDDDDDL